MVKILLLEDDLKLASEIKQYLTIQNYDCDIVHDGLSFLKQPLEKYNLFILDINVPQMSGLAVCKEVRANNNKTPILMLTAFSEVEDKVEALNSGADDYLVKPFHFDELLARINALLRRSKNQKGRADEIIELKDLTINCSTMTVFRQNQKIELSPKEYKILELLARAEGKPVTKQIILSQVWGINFETGTNTIEVYINFLRNKIDKGYDTKLIHTRAGFGYFLKDLCE